MSNESHAIIIPKKETVSDEWKRSNNAWEYKMRRRPPEGRNWYGDGSDDGDRQTLNQFISASDGTVISNATMIDAYLAWNGVYVGTATRGLTSYTTSGLTCYLGKAWATKRVISRAILFGASDRGFQYSINSSMTFYLEGSDTGAWAGEEVSLGSQSYTDYTFARITCCEINSSSITPYLYHRVRLVVDVAGQMQIVEMEFYEPVENAVGVQQLPPYVGSVIDTATARELNAFNGSTTATSTASCYGPNDFYVGKQWQDAKIVSRVLCYASTDYGFSYPALYTGVLTLTLMSSNNGTDWTDLGSQTIKSDYTLDDIVEICADSSDSYLYHAIRMSGTVNPNYFIISEIEFFEGVLASSVEDGDMVVKQFSTVTIPEGHLYTTSDRCRGLTIGINTKTGLVNHGDITMTSRGCHANPVSPEKGGWIDVATDGYTLIGTSTSALSNAFDGTLVKTGSSCTYIQPYATMYVGVDFGVSKKIYKAQTVGPSGHGYGYVGYYNITITLQGSDDNFLTDMNDLSEQTFVDASNSLTKTFTASTYWEYRYYRVKIVADDGTRLAISQLLLFGNSTTLYTIETPVAPTDGNSVDIDGIQFTFRNVVGTDVQESAVFDGCGNAMKLIQGLFPALRGNGQLVTIPRIGGVGATKQIAIGAGVDGVAGMTGQTGGGGCGGWGYGNNIYLFDGIAGTCFAGGPSSSGNQQGWPSSPPEPYGGIGGGNSETGPSPGVGNPSRNYAPSRSLTTRGGWGVGGLLIICCASDILGDGTITSKGSNSSGFTGWVQCTGGASGGGSVVVAHKGKNENTMNVDGGEAGISVSSHDGGDGGAGSIQDIQL